MYVQNYIEKKLVNIEKRNFMYFADNLYTHFTLENGNNLLYHYIAIPINIDLTGKYMYIYIFRQMFIVRQEE